MVENLPNEVWKVHPTYTDYAASNYGRIKSLKRVVTYSNGRIHPYDEKLIKPRPINSGYLQIVICKNGKIVDQPLAHRFVYECFKQVVIPKDIKKYQINHLNEIKTDNRIENLSLCTSKENSNYGTHNERMAEALSKRVAQYDLEGNLVKIWKSTMEAERNGFTSGNIAHCCNGKRKTHKGYLWKYIE